MKHLFSILICTTLSIGVCFSNGLTIDNLSRDSLNRTLSFDLEWNNSWRLDSSSAPYNWDAVWVFVKIRECNVSATIPWEHGDLSSTLGDHVFGNLQPVRSDGSSQDLDPDLKGVMLRRSNQGLFGSAGPTSITLKINNMLPSVAYNVRVVGIEMVFVPQDSFYLGSVTYSNSFSQNIDRNDPSPLHIVSEAAQLVMSHAVAPNDSVMLGVAFPKGYNGYHVMKYELSQGQYATFLNSLAPSVQYDRFLGNINSYRNAVISGGAQPLAPFFSSREDRVQNYLGWDDLAAYLDWAALRPMSEMEYEKTCRGPQAMVLDEYAWGNTNLYEIQVVTSPEDGTEIPANLPSNAHYLNNPISGGDGGYGPVRCGIFALPANSVREQSGATYYGVMEMSGNVWEPCVGALDITSTGGSLNFTSSNGDGALDPKGLANENGWPTNSGYVLRGGSWNNPASNLRVSDRNLTWDGSRDRAIGGRGVRN